MNETITSKYAAPSEVQDGERVGQLCGVIRVLFNCTGVIGIGIDVAIIGEEGCALEPLRLLQCGRDRVSDD